MFSEYFTFKLLFRDVDVDWSTKCEFGAVFGLQTIKGTWHWCESAVAERDNVGLSLVYFMHFLGSLCSLASGNVWRSNLSFNSAVHRDSETGGKSAGENRSQWLRPGNKVLQQWALVTAFTMRFILLLTDRKEWNEIQYSKTKKEI